MRVNQDTNGSETDTELTRKLLVRLAELFEEIEDVCLDRRMLTPDSVFAVDLCEELKGTSTGLDIP